MNAITTLDPVSDLDKTIQALEGALVNREDGNNRGALWVAWRYLQVYSTWGIRLPSSEGDLKRKLSVEEPGALNFFSPMLEGFQKINKACANFQINTFPKVITLGQELLDFASDASPKDGELFVVLDELINEGDDGVEGALELIADLVETTTSNLQNAKEVATMLATFKKELVEAKDVKLADAKSLIAESGNDAKIAKLSGGDDVAGSLKSLTKLMTTQRDDYDHYVVVASTTVTYAWFVPLGTIAAASVAGVYGSKAVEALEELEKTEAKMATAQSELQTAVAIQKIEKLADISIDDAIRYTDQAIRDIVTVQNSWTSLIANLGFISDKASKMTKERNGQVFLKNKRLISNYARKAGEKWDQLIAPLKELVKDPFIVVEPGEKTVKEVKEAVQNEIDRQAIAA